MFQNSIPSGIQLVISNLFCEHFSQCIKILSKPIKFSILNMDKFNDKALCSGKRRLNSILIGDEQNCIVNILQFPIWAVRANHNKIIYFLHFGFYTFVPEGKMQITSILESPFIQVFNQNSFHLTYCFTSNHQHLLFFFLPLVSLGFPSSASFLLFNSCFAAI